MIKFHIIINDRSDGKTQMGMMWDETLNYDQGSDVEQKFSKLVQVALTTVGDTIAALTEDTYVISIDDLSSDISKNLKRYIEKGDL